VSQDKIVVRGAREHNLKNVDLEIPRDQLVVITGLSGSGKSSLAFDTIFAEGQRRYVESLSAYARQFLGQLEKPDVDDILGLSPAISIDQKSASRNPRSTVGTITEIYDHLRLLFARIGRPHCPVCGRLIERQTVSQMVDQILAMPQGSRIMVLAPLVKDRKGEYKHIFDDVRKAGYVRVRVDGQVRDATETFELDRYKMHSIEVVIDRLVVEDDVQTRLADSLETALKLGGSTALVILVDQDNKELRFSELFACPLGHASLEEFEPRTFSFNSPHGACPACTGLGTTMEFDEGLIIPNQHLSLAEGAVVPFTSTQHQHGDHAYHWQLLSSAARHYGIELRTPVKDIPKEKLDKLLYGTGNESITLRYENRYGRTREYQTTYEGIIPNLERRYRETTSDYMKTEFFERFMSSHPCPECKGKRLKPEVLAVTVGDRSIVDITRFSVGQVLDFFDSLDLTDRERLIAAQILKEIRARIKFLVDVGLEYLTLDRAAATLAGGEAQRIRLATQIGSGLMGVLYILDEPSIGLHQRDNGRLLQTLVRLRDIGNTLLVVEHDEETIRTADHVIDIGPGAGEHGGEVVAQGTLDDIIACQRSITGQFLSGRREIRVPGRRRRGSGKFLEIVGAREHNLRDLSVRIPLGMFVGVTGVSGSGKSTLINEILYKRLAQHLYRAKDRPGEHEEIRGLEHLDKVIDVDQSPIGRTPRSNPATYTGVFTQIRETFAQVPEARIRGYQAGRFSFNVKGGRCEACRGEGIIQIEMQFLPDVYVPCEVCKGKRYNREALEIHYKGKTISDVLDMTVEEAVDFFQNMPNIKNKLQVLADVGLGYIRLGQPATTLSGGEAQRIKLSSELSRRSTGRTLYILDEPTTGLHFADIEKLLHVLQRLVDAGNSVIVIEHNLDVVKSVDWIIDLGPEGGSGGGTIIAEGTPEDVAAVERSYTGQFLARMLPGVKPEAVAV
jgi:excinuclease ABC subunit A